MTQREDVEGGRYKMRTFSELTGLSPTVLRAWERRHGLLQPARPEGGHRLYTEEDLQVMLRVTQLLEEGRAIGEIAALGRDALLERVPGGEAPGESDALASLKDQIVESAKRLDSVLLSTTLDRAFATFSLDVVLLQVIEPAAYAIGESWAEGTVTVAGEHMVSAMLRGRLDSIRQTATRPNQNASTVVCACLPREQHELGLLIVALHLANAGYRVAYLGRGLPLRDLKDAVERLQAGALCLSAKRVEIVEESKQELARIAREWSGRIRVHLGGTISPGLFSDLTDSGVRVWSRDLDMQDLFRELFEYA